MANKENRGDEVTAQLNAHREAFFVANLWTEFAAHRSEALATNGKEPKNP